MAEIELSVLSRQCLDRRIPDFETLEGEVNAWDRQRNQKKTWIDWRFTADDARTKLPVFTHQLKMDRPLESLATTTS